MSIKLEGVLNLRGIATDGAETLVHVELDAVAAHLLDPDLAEFLDIFGGAIRNALTRTNAMLTAGL